MNCVAINIGQVSLLYPGIWGEGRSVITGSYSYLIFDNGGKKYTVGKRQSLQQMVLRKLVIYM
jgi:hypothetical protein